MARKERTAPAAGVADMGLWYHPHLGARVAMEAPRDSHRRIGRELAAWTEVRRVQTVAHGWTYALAPGQPLPRGYLPGDPSKQSYGLGGPFVVYAPIERRCRNCRELFTWSARAQKHLYETIGVTVDATAARCQSCARARRAVESARAAYATALRDAEAQPSARAYVQLATRMLELVQRGGRVSLDRAIGFCTRARKLGATASIATVEAKLRALR